MPWCQMNPEVYTGKLEKVRAVLRPHHGAVCSLWEQKMVTACADSAAEHHVQLAKIFA